MSGTYKIIDDNVNDGIYEGKIYGYNCKIGDKVFKLDTGIRCTEKYAPIQKLSIKHNEITILNSQRKFSGLSAVGPLFVSRSTGPSESINIDLKIDPEFGIPKETLDMISQKRFSKNSGKDITQRTNIYEVNDEFEPADIITEYNLCDKVIKDFIDAALLNGIKSPQCTYITYIFSRSYPNSYVVVGYYNPNKKDMASKHVWIEWDGKEYCLRSILENKLGKSIKFDKVLKICKIKGDNLHYDIQGNSYAAAYVKDENKIIYYNKNMKTSRTFSRIPKVNGNDLMEFNAWIKGKLKDPKMQPRLRKYFKSDKAYEDYVFKAQENSTRSFSNEFIDYLNKSAVNIINVLSKYIDETSVEKDKIFNQWISFLSSIKSTDLQKIDTELVKSGLANHEVTSSTSGLYVNIFKEPQLAINKCPDGTFKVYFKGAVKSNYEKTHKLNKQFTEGKCPEDGCVQPDPENEGKWMIISNKTGEPWKPRYDSQESAEAALAAYHANKGFASNNSPRKNFDVFIVHDRNKGFDEGVKMYLHNSGDMSLENLLGPNQKLIYQSQFVPVDKIKSLVERYHVDYVYNLISDLDNIDIRSFSIDKAIINKLIEFFKSIGFKSMSKSDWYGLQGAERFDDGKMPLINYLNDAIMVFDKNGLLIVNSDNNQSIDISMMDLIKSTSKTFSIRTFSDGSMTIDKDPSIIKDNKPMQQVQSTAFGKPKDTIINFDNGKPFFMSCEPFIVSDIVSDPNDGIYVGSLKDNHIDSGDKGIDLAIKVISEFSEPVICIVKGKKAYIWKSNQLIKSDIIKSFSNTSKLYQLAKEEIQDGPTGEATVEIEKEFSDVKDDDSFVEACHKIAKDVLGDAYDEDITDKTAKGILTDKEGDYDKKLGIFRNGLKGFSKSDNDKWIIYDTELKTIVKKGDKDDIINSYEEDEAYSEKLKNGIPRYVAMPAKNKSFSDSLVNEFNFGFEVSPSNEIIYDMDHIIGSVLFSITYVHLFHLIKGKYSGHIALNEYYDEMPEKIDALAEAYLGNNTIAKFVCCIVPKSSNPAEYLDTLKRYLVDYPKYTKADIPSNIQSLIDDIVNQLESTLFKLKRLDNGRKMFSLSKEDRFYGIIDKFKKGVKDLTTDYLSDLAYDVIEDPKLIKEAFKGYEGNSPEDLKDYMNKFKIGVVDAMATILAIIEFGIKNEKNRR